MVAFHTVLFFVDVTLANLLPLFYPYSVNYSRKLIKMIIYCFPFILTSSLYLVSLKFSLNSFIIMYLRKLSCHFHIVNGIFLVTHIQYVQCIRFIVVVSFLFPLGLFPLWILCNMSKSTVLFLLF